MQELLKVMVQKGKEKPLVLHPAVKSKFTVGRSMNCSYTLESTLLPQKHRLIQYGRRGPYVAVPGGVTCELENRQTEQRFKSSELLSLGLLKGNGLGYNVPLPPNMRVILKFGDTAVVVEHAGAASAAITEPLPWALRIPPPKRADFYFLGILFLCFATTFLSIWQILLVDLPQKQLNVDLEKRYAKLILEVPVTKQELYSPPWNEKEPQPEQTPEKTEKQEKPKETAAGKTKGPAGGAPKNLQKKGLLGQMQSGGVASLLQSKEMKDVFAGVGVLTTKRPAGQKMAGPSIAYRDASGVDDLVAGIARRGGGGDGGVGAGGGKKTAAVGNPFDVSGSGAQHALRSYAEIDQVIRKYLQGVRYLYERYLRSDPLMKGRVTLKFSISPEGKVVQCTVVSSSMGRQDFEQELVKRVMLWRFPAIESSAGNVSVVYPFTFLPKTTQ